MVGEGLCDVDCEGTRVAKSPPQAAGGTPELWVTDPAQRRQSVPGR